MGSRSVLCSLRAGRSLAAHPANLFLSVVILLVILAIAGAIVVDQYPYWKEHRRLEEHQLE
jgi:hypothetical protein